MANYLIEKAIFAPLNDFGNFVKTLLGKFIVGLFRVLDSVPLIYVSIPLPVPHSIDYCSYK